MSEKPSLLWQADAVELAAMVRHGTASARELTQAALGRCDAVNAQINAVVRRFDEEALAAADAADAARARGEALGPLHGVPITIKCNVDQAGHPTDNGVHAFRDLVATRDAPLVTNLRRAGAIIIGRTNTPAFSMRGHTDNALHGSTVNPRNFAITPGGSSGGAGAAIACGIGAIAHGNDIGGSIRWPAYCNGVLGLRPSYGRVPRVNFSAPGGRNLASQLMSVDGPLARSVRDLRVALAVMAQEDHRDPRWVPAPLQFADPPRPIRVALVTGAPGPVLHPGVRDSLEQAGRCLEAAGYRVEEACPPRIAEVEALWHAIGITEQANLLWPRVRELGDEGARRFMGWWIEQHPPKDLAGYLQAFISRDALRAEWNAFFQTYPVVVMPASSQPAPRAGSDVRNPQGARAMLESLWYQLVLPVLGLPGLAMPVGMVEGMPGGVQLTAARYREDLLLDAAAAIETHLGVCRPIDPVPPTRCA